MPANPLILPQTKWAVKGTVVQKDGKNFFAKGVSYSPLRSGAPLMSRGSAIGSVSPWWTYDGTNNTNDIGKREHHESQGHGGQRHHALISSVYWMKQPDNTYLQDITQNTPMTVYTDTQYPYTVFYDHTEFLDACYRSGIQVVLGIPLEGGNCFNFSNPSVSSPYQNFYLQTAQKLATLYGKHPAILGFCMGNEQNSGGVGQRLACSVYYQSMYTPSRRWLRQARHDRLPG